MIVSLKRKINVNVYNIICEIEFTKKKPGYQDIFKNCLDGKSLSNEKLKIYVSNHYSAEITDLICPNLIRSLKSLHLIDDNKDLTKLGEYCLKNAQIIVKEKGSYLLWCVDDEIYGKNVIHFSRVERERSSDNVSDNFPLSEIESHNFQDRINEATIFNISKLCGKNSIPYIQDPSKNSKLDFLWKFSLADGADENFKDSLYYVKGRIKSESNTPQEIKEYKEEYSVSNYDLILNQILNDNWNSELKFYLISESDLEIEEILNFRKNFSFHNIDLSDLGFGLFDNIELDSVPIGPNSKESAENWLLKIVTYNSDDRFLSPLEYSNIVEEILEKKEMSLFSDFLNMTQEDTANWLKTKNLTKNYWHIQAPIDLNF